jgi:translation initiation factor 2B subunit (eIF-2B alpha/beta/delta family)
VLTAADPIAAAWLAADEIDRDPTTDLVTREVPDEATLTLVGWPSLTAAGIRRRGDLEVLVVDAAGDGSALVRRLEGSGIDAVDVAESGLGAAATVSDLVVIEALAAGPSGALAASGSHAVAAVARHAGVPVWLVAGVGRVLPERLWEALTTRLDQGEDEPWDRPEELVPSDLVDFVIGADGLEPAADALARSTCPIAPELLRAAG